MYLNPTAERRAELTAYVEEAKDVTTGLIGQLVMPVYSTDERAGRYPKVTIAATGLLDVGGGKRGPSGTYPQVGRSFDWDTYDTEETGLEERVDDALAKDHAKFFDVEKMTTNFITRAMLLQYERDVASKIMSPSNSGFASTDSTVAYTAANIATMDFVADFQAAMERMELRGYTPNTLVLSRKIYNMLTRSKLVQDWVFGRVPSSGGSQITKEILKDKFEIENIHVCGRAYNAGKKGQVPDLSAIWGTSYIALLDVKGGEFANGGAGRTIIWDADSPGGLFTTETYRQESTRSDMMRVRSNRSLKIIDAKAGELIATQYA